LTKRRCADIIRPAPSTVIYPDRRPSSICDTLPEKPKPPCSTAGQQRLLTEQRHISGLHARHQTPDEAGRLHHLQSTNWVRNTFRIPCPSVPRDRAWTMSEKAGSAGVIGLPFYPDNSPDPHVRAPAALIACRTRLSVVRQRQLAFQPHRPALLRPPRRHSEY